MGVFTEVSPGNSIRKRKTRKLSEKELEASRNTILAAMFPGIRTKTSVRDLSRSKIWRRKNDPEFFEE